MTLKLLTASHSCGTEEVEWMIVPLSILVSLGCHW
ncbi:hypothetical protein SAMN05216535_1316 [Stutzerimonas xanthomarina]|uniref:Uncharacterized protein n=2 Tax=Stutzerimonas xanthomarina TaxID=271420 RepID=A0A1M5QUG3_9GAMM|nr:hypothetical protein SAMN05216535_1316 [Stutzerimonas xanthomarina]SHH17349.1 hypothetical protein SAMN02744645_2830 [Stutzerimonas xanthomarina DSM 18231]